VGQQADQCGAASDLARPLLDEVQHLRVRQRGKYVVAEGERVAERLGELAFRLQLSFEISALIRIRRALRGGDMREELAEGGTGVSD
jgi:hypothetical protein